MGLLNPYTHEVPSGDLASYAVAIWASLPREEREQTLLLTAGRALRAEANMQAQAVLKARGEIAQQGVTIPILDRVNLTREQMRHLEPYQRGRIVEFRNAMPRQGWPRARWGAWWATRATRCCWTRRRGASRSRRTGWRII
jgi:hypothetical protein